jgi:hypothetical protein
LTINGTPGIDGKVAAIDARNNNIRTVSTDTRITIDGATIFAMIPRSHFAVDDPAVRFTAFRHGGGFVNGFTAEGIYYAMVSGELAARAVVATTARSLVTLARRYRRACDREIGAELRDSVLVQRYLFADRRRIARVIESAARSPAATGLILEFVVGRMGYPELRRRLLMQAPGLAALVMWERLRAMFAPGGAAAETPDGLRS